VHHAHLEGVACETEVALDPLHEALDAGVRADGPAAPADPVGAGEPRVETLLVRPPQQPLERAPVRALDLLEKLGLSHTGAPL